MKDDKDNSPGEPPVWTRAEVQSPCVNICVIHPEARICTGCFRTIEEITRWSRMTPFERDAIMKGLDGRAVLLRQRRGGRAARLGRSD